MVTRTMIGKKLRATTDNEEAARLVGINTNIMALLATVISLVLSGMAGSLLSIIESFYPRAGLEWQIEAFVILVLAGFGRLEYVLAAGLLLGAVRSLSALIMPVPLTPIIGLFAVLLSLLIRSARLRFKGIRSSRHEV